MSIELLLTAIAEAVKENTAALKENTATTQEFIANNVNNLYDNTTSLNASAIAQREGTLTMQELIAAITETKQRFGAKVAAATAKVDAAIPPAHVTVDTPAPAVTTEPKRRKKQEAAPTEHPAVTPPAEVETPKSVVQTQTDAHTQTTAAAEVTASDVQLPKVNNSEDSADSPLTKEARIALAKEAVMLSNNDANVVRELLKPFGAAKISELTESQASAFDATLRALVAKLKAKEDDGIY